MNRTGALAAMLLATGTLAACDHSRSSAQVARDTAIAEQAAADSAARVQQKADARLASARGEARDEQRDLAHADAVEAQRIAAAQTEGDFQGALARCDALAGATRQACRDQASADYDVAKGRAKQDRAGADPKP